MRLAILSLLASAAFAQPAVVRVGSTVSVAKPALPGPGIIITPVSEGELHSLDTAAVQKLIAQEVAAALKTAPTGTPPRGSGSLDFPPMADGTCSADMNFPLAGAVAAITPIWPEIDPGVLPLMRVIAPGMIAVRLCNLSGATINPPARTYGAEAAR